MATSQPLPRENLVRALHPGYELRAEDSEDDDGKRTMFGEFAKFGIWTEINSWFEGHFLENIARGAFKKTFRENRERIRALFQHGHDPQIGDKPLGTIDELHETDTGAAYEVGLLDTQYVRELIPGLEAGLYGASFRFEVIREDFNEEPDASEHNPKGLPERTLKEIRLHEFGPVTFPAYVEATADIRSLTDQFIFDSLARDPELARSLLTLKAGDLTPERETAAPPQEDAAATPVAPLPLGAARSTHIYGAPREEKEAWRL